MVHQRAIHHDQVTAGGRLVGVGACNPSIRGSYTGAARRAAQVATRQSSALMRLPTMRSNRRTGWPFRHSTTWRSDTTGSDHAGSRRVENQPDGPR
jgi:hypothetical protein